nr:hypothetical protein [uncultured Devosia sp.]
MKSRLRCGGHFAECVEAAGDKASAWLCLPAGALPRRVSGEQERYGGGSVCGLHDGGRIESGCATGKEKGRSAEAAAFFMESMPDQAAK